MLLPTRVGLGFMFLFCSAQESECSPCSGPMTTPPSCRSALPRRPGCGPSPPWWRGVMAQGQHGGRTARRGHATRKTSCAAWTALPRAQHRAAARPHPPHLGRAAARRGPTGQAALRRRLWRQALGQLGWALRARGIVADAVCDRIYVPRGEIDELQRPQPVGTRLRQRLHPLALPDGGRAAVRGSARASSTTRSTCWRTAT